jgi:phage anti-repressor protein
MEKIKLSNNGLHIFKPDNSKLISLTSQMLSQGQIKTSLEFAKNFMFTFDSKEQFPINIMTLIEMKVYDRKDSVKKALIKHFEKDTDYCLTFSAPINVGAENVRHGGAGLNKESIMLTTDCFKNMCMMPRNDIGKKVQRYYLDLEKVFKQYMIIEYQEQQHQNFLLQQKHNAITRKHYFYKFKTKGPAFYIIASGLEYKDDVIRIKIGICGCPKRKIQNCPHCNECLEDNKDNDSIDTRLGDHRTLWPRLQVKFVVYTLDAELLEKCMKRAYRARINPNGHEIIEGISVNNIIEKTNEYLEMFNIFNLDQEYLIEDNVEMYNKKTLEIMKNVEEYPDETTRFIIEDSDDEVLEPVVVEPVVLEPVVVEPVVVEPVVVEPVVLEPVVLEPVVLEPVVVEPVVLEPVVVEPVVVEPVVLEPVVVEPVVVEPVVLEPVVVEPVVVEPVVVEPVVVEPVVVEWDKILCEIEKCTDKRLKEILREYKLPLSGVKSEKKDRVKIYIIGMSKVDKCIIKTCDKCKIEKKLSTDTFRKIREYYKNTCKDCELEECKTVPVYRRPIHTVILPNSKSKRCPGCNTVKSYDDFHKNKSNRDGLVSRCTNCESNRKSGVMNVRLEKPKPKGVKEGYKWCPKCEVIKDNDDFRKATKRKDGLQSMCRICDNDAKKRNRLKNNLSK